MRSLTFSSKNRVGSDGVIPLGGAEDSFKSQGCARGFRIKAVGVGRVRDGRARCKCRDHVRANPRAFDHWSSKGDGGVQGYGECSSQRPPFVSEGPLVVKRHFVQESLNQSTRLDLEMPSVRQFEEVRCSVRRQELDEHVLVRRVDPTRGKRMRNGVVLLRISTCLPDSLEGEAAIDQNLNHPQFNQINKGKGNQPPPLRKRWRDQRGASNRSDFTTSVGVPHNPTVEPGCVDAQESGGLGTRVEADAESDLPTSLRHLRLSR